MRMYCCQKISRTTNCVDAEVRQNKKACHSRPFFVKGFYLFMNR